MGQRSHIVQAAPGKAVTGTGCGHVAGALPVMLGIQGVGHPKFQPGAELLFERGSDLVVAAGGKNEVDTEGESAHGHCLDVGNQLLVLPFEGAPTTFRGAFLWRRL
ncbi:hypothetical protein GCM10012285_50810 [Streptomyces kronopolitis]|uniref:Uncharacterized protein n=1 Tax=Streptomyces kronopolitis TaxID=1612435 RepID=A0ABQ2JV00_9ACTN|nr:hypothetical protein GCM10012285_50810 [Streptomyces kronopolitis]